MGTAEQPPKYSSERPIGEILATEQWSVPAMVYHETMNFMAATNLNLYNCQAYLDLVEKDQNWSSEERKRYFDSLFITDWSRVVILSRFVEEKAGFEAPIIPRLIGSYSLHLDQAGKKWIGHIDKALTTNEAWSKILIESLLAASNYERTITQMGLSDKPEIASVFDHWQERILGLFDLVYMRLATKVEGFSLPYLELLSLDEETQHQLRKIGKGILEEIAPSLKANVLIDPQYQLLNFFITDAYLADDIRNEPS